MKTFASRTTILIAISALACVAIWLPLAAQQDDPFADSDFDGHWTGTLRQSGEEIPIAVNLSVANGQALASVMLPDAADPTQVFDPFPTEVRRVAAKRIDLVVDTGREGLAAEEMTLVLKFKKSSGALRVTAKGALKGKGNLVRSDNERRARAIWGGDLLLALDEGADGEGRFRVAEITGHSWSDDADVRGSVSGTRDGNRVSLTIATPGGDLEFTGTLKGGDTKLQGELSTGSGNPGRLTFSRASGRGKAMKVKGVSPSEAPAGSVTVVTIKGKNFAEGLMVDTDTAGATVSRIIFESQKSVTAALEVGGGVAAGTQVGLRVRNADGQIVERSGAIEVVGGTGGVDPVSFASEVQPIFTNNCATSGCHTAAASASSLVLAAGSAFGNIVNVPSAQQSSLRRVLPGDADNSYLVRKIRGDAGINGRRMPLNRTPLTDAQIATIVNWINQGAANNRLPR
jgi:hypothetical protein